MGEYKKPWLTFEEQADLLIVERGLVADRDDLIAHLANVGYYRLSGYWYIFKRKPEADKEGEKGRAFRRGHDIRPDLEALHLRQAVQAHRLGRHRARRGLLPHAAGL